MGRHFTARQPFMPVAPRFCRSPSRMPARAFARALGVRVLAMVALALAFAATAADRPKLPPGVLEPTIAGEFALQAGRLDEAVRWYLQAAEAAGGDAGLAERATRIALLAGDDARSAQALALWRKRAPASPALHAAGLALALRRDDAAAARTEFAALLDPRQADGWKHALAALD